MVEDQDGEITFSPINSSKEHLNAEQTPQDYRRDKDFSNTTKEHKVKVKSLSRVRLFATPWTVANQAPLSMGFSRQEYWSGLPFPSPGNLPDPGIEPRSPAQQTGAVTSEPPGKPKKVQIIFINLISLQLRIITYISLPLKDCEHKSHTKNIFTIHMSDYAAFSRIYKELLYLKLKNAKQHTGQVS